MFFIFFGLVSCGQISQETSGSIGAVDEDYTIHDCLFTDLSSSVIQYTSSGGHTLTMILVYARQITTTRGAFCYITSSNIKLEHHFVAIGSCLVTASDGGILSYRPSSGTDSTLDYYSTSQCEGELFRFYLSSSRPEFQFKNSNCSNGRSYSYSSADYIMSHNFITNYKYCHCTFNSGFWDFMFIRGDGGSSLRNGVM